MAADRRPVVRAPEDRWQRLGELLQLRRAELGYRRRPAFTREHDINIRLVTDIENAYRPNTFLTPTLREIAQAYMVTYDSLIAVLGKNADELTPAGPPARDEDWQPPVPAGPRRDADAPYAAPVLERLLELRDRGIADPSGTDLFPAGSRWARVWDNKDLADTDYRYRAWLVAELQRRADERAAREDPPGA